MSMKAVGWLSSKFGMNITGREGGVESSGNVATSPLELTADNPHDFTHGTSSNNHMNSGRATFGGSDDRGGDNPVSHFWKQASSRVTQYLGTLSAPGSGSLGDSLVGLVGNGVGAAPTQPFGGNGNGGHHNGDTRENTEIDANGLPVTKNWYFYNKELGRWDVTPEAPESIRREHAQKLREAEEERLGLKKVAPPPPPPPPGVASGGGMRGPGSTLPVGAPQSMFGGSAAAGGARAPGPHYAVPDFFNSSPQQLQPAQPMQQQLLVGPQQQYHPLQSGSQHGSPLMTQQPLLQSPFQQHQNPLPQHQPQQQQPMQQVYTTAPQFHPSYATSAGGGQSSLYQSSRASAHVYSATVTQQTPPVTSPPLLPAPPDVGLPFRYMSSPSIQPPPLQAPTNVPEPQRQSLPLQPPLQLSQHDSPDLALSLPGSPSANSWYRPQQQQCQQQAAQAPANVFQQPSAVVLAEPFVAPPAVQRTSPVPPLRQEPVSAPSPVGEALHQQQHQLQSQLPHPPPHHPQQLHHLSHQHTQQEQPHLQQSHSPPPLQELGSECEAPAAAPHRAASSPLSGFHDAVSAQTSADPFAVEAALAQPLSPLEPQPQRPHQLQQSQAPASAAHGGVAAPPPPPPQPSTQQQVRPPQSLYGATGVAKTEMCSRYAMPPSMVAAPPQQQLPAAPAPAPAVAQPMTSLTQPPRSSPAAGGTYTFQPSPLPHQSQTQSYASSNAFATTAAPAQSPMQASSYSQPSSASPYSPTGGDVPLPAAATKCSTSGTRVPPPPPPSFKPFQPM